MCNRLQNVHRWVNQLSKNEGILYMVTPVPSTYLQEFPGIDGYKAVYQLAEDAIKGGINMIQLRDKRDHKFSEEEQYQKLLELAKRLRILTRKYSIPLVINDHYDLAIQIGADAVHLGQEDQPYEFLPKLQQDHHVLPFGIGVTVKNVDHAREALRNGATYFGIGPIFPTQTKKDAGTALGLKGLQNLIHEIQDETQSSLRPLIFAIGGISNIDRVIKCYDVGLDGVAVVSYISSNAEPDINSASRRAIIARVQKMKAALQKEF